jgi:hypothetical protein
MEARNDVSEVYNIYCDESCHLEHDQQKVMALGALWCPADKASDSFARIREIKVRHGLKPAMEIKWTKVSPAKLDFYLDLVDYFFDNADLHFRALVVPDKSKLNHARFEQTHDDWYYKMYFELLNVLLDPKASHRIYLDYKDTRGAAKVAKLEEILRSSQYDFQRRIIERVQLVRSHEVELVQLADLLTGAIRYANQAQLTRPAKATIVAHIRKHSGYSLNRTTLLKESKLNVFRWEASGGRQ